MGKGRKRSLLKMTPSQLSAPVVNQILTLVKGKGKKKGWIVTIGWRSRWRRLPSTRMRFGSPARGRISKYIAYSTSLLKV